MASTKFTNYAQTTPQQSRPSPSIGRHRVALNSKVRGSQSPTTTIELKDGRLWAIEWSWNIGIRHPDFR